MPLTACEKNVIDKDIPRTFGGRKVTEETKKALKEILYSLDSYVQGANMFIGEKLLTTKHIEDKKVRKNIINEGNMYVKNVNNVLKVIGVQGPNKRGKYSIPMMRTNEKMEAFKKRVKKVWPDLLETLEITVFEDFRKQKCDVNASLNAILERLDSIWMVLAVGGGNILGTTGPDWTQMTYSVLSKKYGSVKSLIYKLENLFLMLVISNRAAVVDWIKNMGGKLVWEKQDENKKNQQKST